MASQNSREHLSSQPQDSNVHPTVPSSGDAIRSSPPPTSSREHHEVTSSQHPPSDPVSPSNPRVDALVQKRTRLEATIAALEAERAEIAAKVKLPSDLASSSENESNVKAALTAAQRVVKEHIALLHKYNEIKDVGQGLMGMIADTRGVRIASVMEDFGVTSKD